MADTPQVPPHVTTDQERRWLEKNREAIEAYNRRVAEHGLLSDHTGLQEEPS
jgi:post-segregation antitoxin (ccd killing protein)